MIELAVLGLLKERSMHGYELKKELTAQLGQFWQVSYGSLYPAIRRLEKDGAVERVWPKEQVGRRKNFYRITKVGEKVFEQSMAEHGAVDDARFSLKLAFFRYLKPEARVELLERRRAYLTEKLALLKSQMRAYRERLDGYGYGLIEHSGEITQADLQWIDKLIAAEKNGGGAKPSGKR